MHAQQDGSFLVDGSANIRDLNKEMNWELPLNGPKTLSGLIIEYLEDIPKEKISLRIAGYPIEIVEVTENMVKLARVIPELLNLGCWFNYLSQCIVLLLISIFNNCKSSKYNNVLKYFIAITLPLPLR